MRLNRSSIVAYAALLALPALCVPMTARAADEDDPKPASSKASGADDSAPISSKDERVHYALRLDGRGLFVPMSVMSPFLKAGQGLTSGSVGASFVRRKGALDVVVTLDFGFFSPPDGNFLAAGKEAMLDTHWTHFDNLNVLSADVSFYYNADLARWLGISIGAGLGIGVVLGDVYVINNSMMCTEANASDPTKCYPVVNSGNYDPKGQPGVANGAIKPGDPGAADKFSSLEKAQAACQAAGGADCRDTANHPYYHKADKIPVVPVLNVSVGFKFKLHRHFNLNVNGGFRNGFFVGGGPEIVF